MYECHITIKDYKNGIVNKLLEETIKEWGWKFSQIEGDPVLGKGLKCYATQHFAGTRNVDEVISIMRNVAYDLELAGFDVVRQKVELIVYDTKAKR